MHKRNQKKSVRINGWVQTHEKTQQDGEPKELIIAISGCQDYKAYHYKVDWYKTILQKSNCLDYKIGIFDHSH